MATAAGSGTASTIESSLEGMVCMMDESMPASLPGKRHRAAGACAKRPAGRRRPSASGRRGSGRRASGRLGLETREPLT